jgi:hypothetical protein
VIFPLETLSGRELRDSWTNFGKDDDTIMSARASILTPGRPEPIAPLVGHSLLRPAQKTFDALRRKCGTNGISLNCRCHVIATLDHA